MTATAQGEDMNVTTSRARFDDRAGGYRTELLAHAYRMLGTIHDAEDAVQETYLRAWRAYDDFEERSSLRTWLYRIATNACLRAVENRSRRALPTDLAGPAPDPTGTLTRRPAQAWLQPAPDALLGIDAGSSADPSAVSVRRESVRLAFIAALQHLPPRQRAALVLREVLAFSAAESATVLETTPAAVNSLLQRARERIDSARLEPGAVSEPTGSQERELLGRYVRAMQDYDIEALVATLSDDVIWEMPPFPAWFQGARTVGRMVAAQCPAEGPGDQVLVPIMANGQPAFGLYTRDETGTHRPFNLQVLTVGPEGVSHIVAFFDIGLFARFGLPESTLRST